MPPQGSSHKTITTRGSFLRVFSRVEIRRFWDITASMRVAGFCSGVLAMVCGVVLATLSRSDAGLIYYTDFENFTAGPNKWVGTDGWNASTNTTGSHGIDQDVVPGGGLGKTAYLGYAQPSTAPVLVSRSISYNHTSTGVPRLSFQIVLGIQDSTNGRRDNFYVYFYNSLGQQLAAIGFMNNANQGITRSDAVSTVTTAATFLHGELHVLTGIIDLAGNRWSAELDGVPIFQNAVFNANGRSRVLGMLGFLWQIPGGTASNFGNNWMLVSEIQIRSVPDGTSPFRLESFSRSQSGLCALTWMGQPGFDYQVAWSPDLHTWYQNLPGSLFANRTTTGLLQFSETPPTNAGRRFYRVIRKESP